jgi:hypothetical protein
MVAESFVMPAVNWLIIWREQMSYSIYDIDVFVSEKNTYHGKNQTKYSFPNGYGASVVNGEGINRFEVAVLEADGSLCYDTEITSDVIAGLDMTGVYKVLDNISKL